MLVSTTTNSKSTPIVASNVTTELIESLTLAYFYLYKSKIKRNAYKFNPAVKRIYNAIRTSVYGVNFNTGSKIAVSILNNYDQKLLSSVTTVPESVINAVGLYTMLMHGQIVDTTNFPVTTDEITKSAKGVHALNSSQNLMDTLTIDFKNLNERYLRNNKILIPERVFSHFKNGQINYITLSVLMRFFEKNGYNLSQEVHKYMLKIVHKADVLFFNGFKRDNIHLKKSVTIDLIYEYITTIIDINIESRTLTKTWKMSSSFEEALTIEKCYIETYQKGS